MPRLEKPSRANATLSRRTVLAGGAALGLVLGAGGCQDQPLTASRTPRLDMDRLNTGVAEIAERIAPGALGVGLTNLESGEHFSFEGERPFPMAGAFVLPLAAAVTAEAEAGRLSLDERTVLEAQQLSPPPSAIAEAWPARRDFTLGELMTAAVAGDSTAADVLMKRIGGPGAVTAWLDAKRARGVRVDRYAREVMVERHGLPSFRPEWRTEAVFQQALAKAPQPARLAALQRYVADPRDTATPVGMLEFLGKLGGGELVSRAAGRELIRMIRRGEGRAHLISTARPDLGITPALVDVGVFTLPERRAYALTIFASGLRLDEQARAKLLADVAALARSSVG
ncbi:class A beta-lactamase-related serine hydrolase [Phenylobacterium sp. J426]|uniref:class A beta-lactamase-related serine hydrolase n=1 Tax=Phenylobacterium sp. J426 TaxID=2898439 RepID=UPI002150FEC6|nr:class A beta-lactamase-related serine hydrolase [Phenylobacterium sp. J426]MCR5874965.1 class A beta-lactamase-related serine hydrolase [Phenylobacterium sp. J426]